MKRKNYNRKGLFLLDATSTVQVDGTWIIFHLPSDRYTSPSKEAGLVIYLAFLAKVANLYYMILTAFKKYWLDTAAKFISGTQETFI